MLYSARGGVSYSQLCDTADAIIQHDLSPHLVASARVGVVMSNDADSITAFLACVRMGLPTAPLDRNAYTRATDAVAALGLDAVVVPARHEADAGSRFADWLCDLRPEETLRVGPERGLPVGSQQAVELEPRQVDPIELFGRAWLDRRDSLILSSSGSTGTPKRIERPGADFVRNCLRSLSVAPEAQGTTILPLLPMSHQYGLSVLFTAMLSHSGIVVANPTRIKQTLRLARRFGANALESIPDFYSYAARQVESGRLAQNVFENYRTFGVGGAPCPTTLREQVARVMGLPLLDGYGCTELGNIALATPGHPDSMTVLPGVTVRILDSQGHELPYGEIGDVEVTTPDFTDETGAAVPFRSGDYGILEASGVLTVLGRGGALIRNGLVIYPSEIEAKLATGGISACAHAEGGDSEEASPKNRLVVVAEDALRRSRKAARERLERRLTPHEYPDRVEVLPKLPRTGALRKPDRRRAFLYASGAARSLEFPAVESKTAEFARRLHDRSPQIREALAPMASAECVDFEILSTAEALQNISRELVLHGPLSLERLFVYMPTNMLLYSYALHAIIPSFYTSQIVVRPPSAHDRALRAVHEQFADLYETPVELVSCTHGEFADLWRGRPGVIIFTGQYTNAMHVSAEVQRGQVMVYFGAGINPFIIGRDANLELAAADLVACRQFNGGQDCFAPDAVFVDRRVVSEFVGHLRTQVQLTADSSTWQCPIVPGATLRNAFEYLQRSARDITFGGGIDITTGQLEPTIVERNSLSEEAVDEVYSPIYNVMPFDNETDVADLLLSDRLKDRAMCASAYGVSEALTERLADVMTVSLDVSCISTDVSHFPMGGHGARSGFYLVGGRQHTGPLLLSEVVSKTQLEHTRRRESAMVEVGGHA